MNKGLVGSLIGLTRAVLADIRDFHPTLGRGFERDLLRLESLASNHGERVFTLFLPSLGKVFDQALETGVLAFENHPLSRSVNRRTTIPRLFQGMWRLFFDDSGCLKHDVAPHDVLLMRTLLFAFKKYRADCATKATNMVIKEYYDVDLALPPPSPEWDGVGDDLSAMRGRSVLDRLALHTDLFSGEEFSGDDARMLSVVQDVADRVSGVLGEFLPSHSRFRHGPGAVSDLKTGRAYKYAFPAWGPRLQFVFPASEFAEANLSRSLNTSDGMPEGLPLVEGASVLHAVPKTQKGPRLIASEPTCNQWCQQAARDFLATTIRRSYIGRSIDFSRQDLSGALALAASVDKSLATVDLSSASDRLSCWLVERLFRGNHSLLSAFIASRTRYIINRLDKKSPKLYKLRKFASMGSALTFPVQSIVFYMICVSAGILAEGRTCGSIRRIGRQVRVYGDDLIVPVEWMPVLKRLLELLYLKINLAKTFTEGNFRESCGTDAFQGFNVSPGQVLEVFDESSLGTLQGVVDSSNNLYEKGFIRTSAQLLASVPAGIKKYIPWVALDSESFGLRTGSGFSTSARKRWNDRLHYWEYLTFRFRAKGTDTIRHEGFENLLQYFTEDPSTSETLSFYETGVFSKALTVVGRGWEPVPV